MRVTGAGNGEPEFSCIGFDGEPVTGPSARDALIQAVSEFTLASDELPGCGAFWIEEFIQ